MAARFGATIVPVATIGAEDGISILLDSQELLNLPIVGDYYKEQKDKLPRARRGVNETEDVEEHFVQVQKVPHQEQLQGDINLMHEFCTLGQSPRSPGRIVFNEFVLMKRRASCTKLFNVLAVYLFVFVC